MQRFSLKCLYFDWSFFIHYAHLLLLFHRMLSLGICASLNVMILKCFPVTEKTKLISLLSFGSIIRPLVNLTFVLIIRFPYAKVEKHEKIKGKLEISSSGKRWKGRTGPEFAARRHSIRIGGKIRTLVNRLFQ